MRANAVNERKRLAGVPETATPSSEKNPCMRRPVAVMKPIFGRG